MTPEAADALLQQGRPVPVVQGSLSYVKEIRAACLEAGIAAAIVRPPRRGGG